MEEVVFGVWIEYVVQENGVEMGKLLGTRLFVVLMAMLIVMSPTVSAQSTPQADGPASTEAAEPVVPEVTEPEDEAPDVDTAPEGVDEALPPADGPQQSRQVAPDMQVMAAGDGTLVVNVVGSDPDQPVPTNALVCVSVIWSCLSWTGTPLTFTVAPGEYTVSFDMFDESYYTDAISTVTVGADEVLDVTLTLEPRQPSTLRLYVSTDTGAPVPTGTEACIEQDATLYSAAISECQLVSGLFLDFAVNEGWVDVTVTTPVDSGFGSAGETIWVPGGTTYRDYFVLADDADGTVTIDVSTEDGLTLNGIPVLCFQHATEDLEHCSWVGVPIFDGDGGGNYTFQVPAGEWTWLVEPSFMDSQYLPVSGTVTVAEGDELLVEAELPLRTDADVATLTVNVSTFDGMPVPAGSEVCISDAVSSNCFDWTGEPLVIDVAAGAVTVNVYPPEGGDYIGFSLFLPLVQTGDARVVDAVLYPVDTELTLVKTVSDEAPEVGDTVAYTIHAFGPAFEFLIEDTLPAGLTDISVTCAGSFISELPGFCYEIVGGEVVVPGIAGNEAFLDVTLTITGTVTGTPGTTVTNVACVTDFFWQGDVVACDAADFVIAETIVPSPSPSATVVPSETPVVTPTTVPGTPAATGTPMPTQAVDTGDDTTPPAGKVTDPAVTKLPSTGDAGPASASMVLYTVLASAVMLAGAGLLRVRSGARR